MFQTDRVKVSRQAETSREKVSKHEATGNNADKRETRPDTRARACPTLVAEQSYSKL
mgnify:CR=1 FL=1